MSVNACTNRNEVEARARQTLGISDVAIYEMVARALEKRRGVSGVLVDVGCGGGNLWRFFNSRFSRYIGVDLVRYEDLPTEAEFNQTDFEKSAVPLPNDTADVVASLETIEHLENPRAFMRELVRVAKAGGWVVVTTPNQLSFLSLLTLIVKHRFSAFQDVHYPAHLTALLEVDLRRIAAECRLNKVSILYSCHGRVVLTPWHYPKFLARMFPRILSDNLLMIGQKTST